MAALPRLEGFFKGHGQRVGGSSFPLRVDKIAYRDRGPQQAQDLSQKSCHPGRVFTVFWTGLAVEEFGLAVEEFCKLYDDAGGVSRRVASCEAIGKVSAQA